MLGFDGHVYDAVVREQPELTVCQVIREVVNVDQEQDRSQDCSLRNTTCDRHSRWWLSINHHCFCTISKKSWDPVKWRSRNAIPGSSLVCRKVCGRGLYRKPLQNQQLFDLSGYICCLFLIIPGWMKEVEFRMSDCDESHVEVHTGFCCFLGGS